jgi:hypothetical protein
MRRLGQALVEFALAISVFLLLVLGTFDLARAYLAYTVVTNAAREASRYAAVHVGEAGWDTAAIQTGVNMAIGLDTSSQSLSFTVASTTIGTLPYVTVSGTYQFHSLTPLVGALLGDPIPIRVDTSTLAG